MQADNLSLLGDNLRDDLLVASAMTGGDPSEGHPALNRVRWISQATPPPGAMCRLISLRSDLR
jgi:hypothetical protein